GRGPHRVPVGDHLRHPHRVRRTAARTAREGALHARRGPRVGHRPHPARRDLRPMTTTPAAPHPTTSPGDTPMSTTTTPTTKKKRLTTSAMIASFADPGQPT